MWFLTRFYDFFLHLPVEFIECLRTYYTFRMTPPQKKKTCAYEDKRRYVTNEAYTTV